MCTISQKCSKGVGGWDKLLGDGKMRFRDKVIIIDMQGYYNVGNCEHFFTELSNLHQLFCLDSGGTEKF